MLNVYNSLEIYYIFTLKNFSRQKKTKKTTFIRWSPMMTKEVQRVKCESCSEETTNYYPILINRGKIFLCAECYENSIRRSTSIYNNPTNKNKNK